MVFAETGEGRGSFPGHSSGPLPPHPLLGQSPLLAPSTLPPCHTCGAASHPLSACACSIFLIDHAWTCRVEHARQQLHQVPGLLHRMANLMGVEFHGELPSAEAVDLVLEEMWRFNQTYQLAHGVSGPGGGGRQGCGPLLLWAIGAGRVHPGEPGPGPWGPPIPCGLIMGLFPSLRPPSAGDPGVWGPLSSQDTTLPQTLDLSPTTWLPISWCLQFLSSPKSPQWFFSGLRRVVAL